MRHCRVCTSEKKVKIIQYFCRKCDCSLWIVPYFELWQCKTRFWTYLY
jgi:hypothetical protein